MVSLLLLIPGGFAQPSDYFEGDAEGDIDELTDDVNNVRPLLMFFAICQWIQVVFTILCIFLPTHIYLGN